MPMIDVYALTGLFEDSGSWGYQWSGARPRWPIESTWRTAAGGLIGALGILVDHDDLHP